MTKQFTEFILVVESSSNGGPGISLRNHDSLQPSPIPSNSVQMSNTSTFTSRSSILSKSPNSSQRTGKFQLLGDVLTRFSDHCTNTVTQTSSVAKSEIQVISTSFFQNFLPLYKMLFSSEFYYYHYCNFVLFNFRSYGELRPQVVDALLLRPQWSKISKKILIFN